MTDEQRTMAFPVSVEELWDAICDPAVLGEWFAGDVDVDLRPGGALRVSDGEHVRSGVIDVVEPQRRLAFTWTDELESPASTVELELEPCDEGCELRVRESLCEVAEVGELAPAPVPFGFQPPSSAQMRVGGSARALARV